MQGMLCYSYAVMLCVKCFFFLEAFPYVILLRPFWIKKERSAIFSNKNKVKLSQETSNMSGRDDPWSKKRILSDFSEAKQIPFNAGPEFDKDIIEEVIAEMHDGARKNVYTSIRIATVYCITVLLYSIQIRFCSYIRNPKQLL